MRHAMVFDPDSAVLDLIRMGAGEDAGTLCFLAHANPSEAFRVREEHGPPKYLIVYSSDAMLQWRWQQGC